MSFTNRICDKEYFVPLNSELMKKGMEYKALGVLKYCFGGIYHSMKAADKPDLQMQGVGIEVTEAVDFQKAQAMGEFIKKRKQGIINESININEHIIDKNSITWKPEHIEDERECLEKAFERKLKKISGYRQQGFDKLGLFIIYEEPLFPMTVSKCFDWFQQLQNGREAVFDFAYLLAAQSLGFFDFISKKSEWISIERGDMDLINKLSRMTAEGDLGEEDIEWRL